MFKVLSDEEIEKKYNCTGTRNSSHYALVTSIIKDPLRQVVEMLDGHLKRNPKMWYGLPHKDRYLMISVGDWETIKQAIRDISWDLMEG